VKNCLLHIVHRKTLTCLVLVLLPLGVVAQSENQVGDNRHNKISIAITHTFVPTAIGESGDKKWLSLASWGLDYDHYFNSAWGVGLHSDIVIENFQYEDGDAIKERKSPLALALMATRKLSEHLTLMGGGGLEVSSGEETLALIRIGADYGWELRKDWEVSLSLMTDLKIGAYNAFVFGFGIGKKF